MTLKSKNQVLNSSVIVVNRNDQSSTTSDEEKKCQKNNAKTCIDNSSNDKKEVEIKYPQVSIIKLFKFATITEKILIIIAAILSIISGFLHPFSILLYGNYISAINGVNEKAEIMDKIIPIILNITYSAISIMASAYLSTLLWIRTGEAQARRIRQLYLHSILKQDMCWFDRKKDDSLTTRLAIDTQAIQDGISEEFGLCLSYLSQFITGFIIAFYKGYRMALVMFVILPLLIGITTLVAKFTRKNVQLCLSANSQAGSVAEQAFRFIHTVQSFSLQQKFIDKFESKSEDIQRYQLKKSIFSSIASSVYYFIFFGFMSLSLWYGSRLVADKKSDAASIYVIFIQMTIGNISITRFLPHIVSMANACGAASNVYGIIQSSPQIDIDNEKGEKLQTTKGDIEFKNVSFNYPTRPDVSILKNISFSIKPGTTVAFVGSSGSGKSTIIQLLQRFYDPNSGNITLDGYELNGLNLQWLRQTIGVVGQQPVLFNATIRENLRLGSNRPITDEEMITACKDANCHKFIVQLPLGYDTVVGDNGAMLSGGQKQRIAIARAIIKNPSILLLDEATSALDVKSERLVQHALDKASATRTTIVVAHRLSTITNADMIFVVNKGNIVEQGTHQSLISLNGLYADLVRKQEIETTQKEEQEIISQLVEEEEKDTRSSFIMSEKEDGNPYGQQYHRLTKVFTGSTGYSISIKSANIVNHAGETSSESSIKNKKFKETVSSWKIVKEMKSEWKLLSLGIIGATIQACILPFYGYCFSSVISVLGQSTSEQIKNYAALEGINLYSFLFVIVAIISFVSNGLNRYYFARSGQKFSHRLRMKVFAAYMKQELGYFDENDNNVGILISRLIVDTTKMSSMIADVWGQVIEVVVSFIASTVIGTLFSWQITLISLSLTPIIVLASSYEVFLQKVFESKNKNASIESSKVANESIREVRTVASLNQQSYFEKRYLDATEKPHLLTIKKSYISSFGSAFYRGSTIFSRAIIFYAGALFIMKGYIDFRQLFVSLTILLVTAETAGTRCMFGSVIVEGKFAGKTIFDILERQPKIDLDLEGIEPNTEAIRGDIDFKNIKFSYPTRPGRPILDGKFNLNGKSGQTIALVGPSGCGKSTTIGLLQRWYDTDSGTVSLDQTNVKNYSLKNLRSHMAVVSQEPVLFDMTIRENILFGANNEVSNEEIEEVCKAANIHNFIKGLPDGYDTRVGDKGSQLSGGQRQRIAIARALIRKPKILLLDEATSALDSESERLVQEALDNIIQEGGRTTITIAHRLSTITNADIIYVIDKGEVIEQGTHQELMILNGFYAKLVKEQLLNK